MNDLTIENWIGLAIVFIGIVIADRLAARVARSVDPDRKPHPPAE